MLDWKLDNLTTISQNMHEETIKRKITITRTKKHMETWKERKKKQKRKQKNLKFFKLGCVEINLLDFFDLLVKTTNHIICRIRNLFNFHKVDQRIYFAWQDQMKNIAVIAERNSSRRCNLCDINAFVDINNIFPFRMNLIIERNK